MVQLKHLCSLLLLLIGITGAVFGQQTRFRNVMGNTGHDIGMSAQQTFDKGYIVCGSTTSVGSGNTDIYVIKTDSLGIPTNEISIGGINIDRGNCIQQTLDSGYVLVGYTNDINSLGGYDICVLKLDSKLKLEWKKSYGGSDWDFGNSIQATSDGGYIICGGTYSFGKGDEDYFLIKTNAAGDTLWTRTYGGVLQDEAKSVKETKDGGYILTGFSMSKDTLGDFYTVKTNDVGDTLWTNTFGGTQMDLANDVVELQGGGYAVGGETKSFGAKKSDIALLEITLSGASNRTFTGGGAEDEYIVSLTQRKDGMIGFAGTNNSFGLGKGDVYFGMIYPDFNFNNATTFGSNGKDIGNSVACTDDNGFIICGTTNGFRNFLDDIFLIKTDSFGYASVTEKVIVTNIPEVHENDFNFTVYPNPADDQVTIYLPIPQDKATIKVTDLMGRILKQELIRSSVQESIPFSLGILNSGLYLITISTPKSSFSRPLIVKHE